MWAAARVGKKFSPALAVVACPSRMTPAVPRLPRYKLIIHTILFPIVRSMEITREFSPSGTQVIEGEGAAWAAWLIDSNVTAH